MFPRRHHLALAVLLSCVAVAGCGSGDGSEGGGDGSGRSADTAAERVPESGSPEAPEGRSSSTAFADSPEIAACMEAAGFAADAPPTGALQAWRHEDGAARAAVASSPDVTDGIEAELAGAGQPTETVEDLIVLAGVDELRAAAQACLT